MKQASLPFPVGQTFWEGDTSLISTTDADGLIVLGRIYEVEDIDWSASAGQKTLRSNRGRRLMAVRNSSGGTLTKKLIAAMKADGTAKEFLGQVSGLAESAGVLGYPIDEWLTHTVAANDIFYVVVGGPAMCTTAAAGDTTIGTGALVVASTGGKVVDQDLSGGGGDAAAIIVAQNAAQRAIGFAVLAVNATNADILVDVIPRTEF